MGKVVQMRKRKQKPAAAAARDLEGELEQARLVLGAILKTLGRVRVDRSVLDNIDESDKVDAREEGSCVVFEHRRT